MSERHPFIYNEFDIEAARNAGKSSEQERIIKLLTDLSNLFYLAQAGIVGAFMGFSVLDRSGVKK